MKENIVLLQPKWLNKRRGALLLNPVVTGASVLLSFTFYPDGTRLITNITQKL